MKIAFNKISSVNYPFRLDLDNLVLEGNLTRKTSNIVSMKAVMKGGVIHCCDSCAEEIELEINENIELDLSDGVYKDLDDELSDTMEFFDGEIDLIEVLKSELALYLSDYFYCKNCK